MDATLNKTTTAVVMLVIALPTGEHEVGVVADFLLDGDSVNARRGRALYALKGAGWTMLDDVEVRESDGAFKDMIVFMTKSFVGDGEAAFEVTSRVVDADDLNFSFGWDYAGGGIDGVAACEWSEAIE